MDGYMESLNYKQNARDSCVKYREMHARKERKMMHGALVDDVSVLYSMMDEVGFTVPQMYSKYVSSVSFNIEKRDVS